MGCEHPHPRLTSSPLNPTSFGILPDDAMAVYYSVRNDLVKLLLERVRMFRLQDNAHLLQHTNSRITSITSMKFIRRRTVSFCR
ncbi:hypothetical protein K474DRAFT_1658630 [Panus rudis PR-1116 ss-1]|nr:hypothetical protein K474DRAFT_1658630 [Panus rudis PR-1116 ss-1]